MQATHHPKLPREIPIMYKEWGMQQVPWLGRTHSLQCNFVFPGFSASCVFLLEQDPKHIGSKYIETKLVLGRQRHDSNKGIIFIKALVKSQYYVTWSCCSKTVTYFFIISLYDTHIKTKSWELARGLRRWGHLLPRLIKWVWSPEPTW